MIEVKTMQRFVVILLLLCCAVSAIDDDHDRYITTKCRLDSAGSLFRDCDALVAGELSSVSQNTIVLQRVSYLHGGNNKPCNNELSPDAAAAVSLSVNWGKSSETCYNSSSLVVGKSYLFCSHKDRWKKRCSVSASQPFITVPKAMTSSSSHIVGATSTMTRVLGRDIHNGRIRRQASSGLFHLHCSIY